MSQFFRGYAGKLSSFLLMFAKIFEQIYDSSIADDWQTRVVFQDLLILADSDGVVDKTHESIAARTRIPIALIKKAIDKLEQPDPRSRTPEEEGRRIIRIDPHRDWGWQIVNYKLYRDMRKQFDRKAYMRRYMRGKREAENSLDKTSVKPEFNKSLTESNKSFTQVNNVKLSPSPSSCTEGSVRGGKPSLTPEQIRLGGLFNRRESTGWSAKEVAAYREIGTISEDDFKSLERYYAMKLPESKDFRRTSLLTLLNNFGGELDKARNLKEPKPF